MIRLSLRGRPCVTVAKYRQPDHKAATKPTPPSSERAAEALQHDLIKADAPFEMMQTFFGLSSRECSRLRRVLAAAPAVGRPPEADEASQQTLWAAWTRGRKGTDADPLPPQVYLGLQLDARMAFEALILQRLQWIPTGRRQEWLRGLLVQGFLAECQQRREADGEAYDLPGATTRRPGTAFAGWLTERSSTPHDPPAATSDPSDPPRPAAVATSAKPFAHLRKVIG